MCEIYSNLTVKTVGKRRLRHSYVVIDNFE